MGHDHDGFIEYCRQKNKEETMAEQGNNLEEYWDSKLGKEDRSNAEMWKNLTLDEHLKNHTAFKPGSVIECEEGVRMLFSDTKAEDGKVKPSLAGLPAQVLLSVASVFTFGGTKYYPNKWLKEPTSSFTRVDSALRHINSWLQGIDTDNESKLHHLDHAITQLIMAKEYINLNITDGRVGKDD